LNSELEAAFARLSREACRAAKLAKKSGGGRKTHAYRDAQKRANDARDVYVALLKAEQPEHPPLARCSSEVKADRRRFA
jgi:hypothetical protein